MHYLMTTLEENKMKFYTAFAILPAFLLCGCLATTGPAVVDHNVIVQVPCNVTMPDKPVFPLTDSGKVEDNIFDKSKKALAEIEDRKAYETKLEAAAQSCTDKGSKPVSK